MREFTHNQEHKKVQRLEAEIATLRAELKLHDDDDHNWRERFAGEIKHGETLGFYANRLRAELEHAKQYSTTDAVLRKVEEIDTLRARVASLEGALLLWDKWHIDNCCLPHNDTLAYPPPLSETYAALEADDATT